MLIVPRYVSEARGRDDFMPENRPKALVEYRDRPAWVLLGEPGAGKSEALKAEAEASGGIYLSVAEFLNLDIDEGWRGKPLFLDGLDEARADGSDEGALLRIRARLNALGNPSFRIACRAADWFGSTDRDDLRGASRGGRVAVLLLEPLNDHDISDILRENHGVSDPAAFVDKARRHGVQSLLRNPQTLDLLARAIRGQQWPESRQQVFELACEALAQEANKRYRNKQRLRTAPFDKVIDAAGQLGAALLLADKTGIALDKAASDERFPPLDGFLSPDPEMALASLRTRLFRSAEGEERMVPSHRSIAEYLAARWLAKQVGSHGLPVERVLNLLLGIDGRTVSGLRGLYAWLALCCQTAQAALIEADPLTVVIYGDVKRMSPAIKRLILGGLRREAQRHTAFRWVSKADYQFGALADPALIDDFRAILESPERCDAQQSLVECVLTALGEGDPMPALADVVKRLVVDSTRWGKIRQVALEIWLKWSAPVPAALTMLDAIAAGAIEDGDDELTGILLSQLYSREIAPENLLRYLHVRKNKNLVGSYSWFWAHELPQRVSEAHLTVLLDQLSERADLTASDDRLDFHLRRTMDALVVKGVLSQGEQVSDERLFAWLGIGAGEYGDIDRDEAIRLQIAQWLEAHPNRYKGVLALCYSEGASKARPGEWLYVSEEQLHGAAPPSDIGLWHLEQAARNENDVLAERHLCDAVNCLGHQRGDLGLSLEIFEAWAAAHPDKQVRLQSMMVCEIPEERKERAARKAESRMRDSESRRIRRIELSKHLEAIPAGKANAALMHELACVWLGHFSDAHGETPRERFVNYCENGEEILALAEAGFRACVERDDLPSVDEIIALSTNQQEPFIRQPCLVGMELRWRDGLPAVDALSDDTLRRMVAFRLTYGADNTPDWFVHLVESRPELVADVLVTYASVTLKARKDHVDGIYPLAHEPIYAEVARLAVPALLEGFPLRARSGQLNYLEQLLKAGLRHAFPQFASLIEKKTAIKSLDIAQKVYWLTCGTLLDPERYESTLWRYVGSSIARANHVSAFLSKQFGELDGDYRLSAYGLARLIELLAPHAELDWPRGGGFVNEAMRRGDHVRALITRLGALGTEGAETEIERLLALPALTKLKLSLENSRHQSRLIRRENAFRFPNLAGVVSVLANREPASAADLASLVLAHLDGIARDIRQENVDLFRQFWTETKENKPKPENSCRDALLDKLKSHLAPFGIDCVPEADYFNDKRADIRIAYRNDFDLPVEIKRDDNASLWTALRTQLMAQYIVGEKAGRYGIYLILWFGRGDLPASTDGGKKPTTPEELRARIEALLNPEERKRVFVRVLDVSWPMRKKCCGGP